MKSFSNFFTFLMLALTFRLSNAVIITNQRRGVAAFPREECGSSEFIECIVSLAELPLQITTCLEALNDLSEEPQDPIKTDLQGADCIAEATLAAVELPSHCAGCLAALDGECPNADVPCTGPPPASGMLPGRR